VTQALAVVGTIFIVVYAPLAVLAWRRPLLARLAFRESIRRRGQFALLVLGLMVGSASITAALFASDSSIQSYAAAYYQRLGGADLTVTAPGGQFFPLAVAQRLNDDPALSKYVAGAQGGADLPASVADLDRRLGKSDVLLIGFDPAAQRPFGAYRLTDGRRIYGTELAVGDVVLSRDLATSLDARPGDQLRISVGADTHDANLRVYGIAAASGLGAYSSPLAAYMTLDTVHELTGDAGINVVRVVARNSNLNDSRPARLAAAPVRAAISQIPSANTLIVNEVRVEAESQLQNSTAWILGTTLGFSGFVVLAATALIVNLVFALAQERRPRLAVLRALGLTRPALIAISVLEGAVYSLAAAAAGLVIGVAAGLYLAAQIWSAAVGDPTDAQFAGIPLQVTIRPGTLALAFAAGAIITLGTVAAAAFRTSRMAIASAVRDLPEPDSLPPKRNWRRIALVAASLVLGAALVVPNDLRFRLVGGVILIAGVTSFSRDRLPDRARFTLGGLLLSAWVAIVAASFNFLSDVGILVFVFAVGVPIMAVGLTIASAANLKLIDAFVGLLGSRFGELQATLRPPLAYLSRRPLRTGLTISAFALVLVMVTLIAVSVGSGPLDYTRDSAGYDIQVSTQSSGNLVLPAAVEHQIASQVLIPMRVYQGPFEGANLFTGSGPDVAVTFYVLPDGPNGWGPVALNAREKRFSNDAAVWNAVRSETGLIVGDWGNGITPGTRITIQGLAGMVPLRLAASPSSTVLNGYVVSSATAAEIPTRPFGSTMLLKVIPGADARALAHQIERSLFDQGVQATTTREILQQDYSTNINYTIEYDVLLHMGLVVAVLALAMVTIRAAVERRRTIGVLRAIGFQRSRIMSGLIVEGALTATIGAVSGILAGLLIGYVLDVAQSTTGFGVDGSRMEVALTIVFATVLAVTVPIAWRVSRLAPIDAIRTTG
jgi:putative ABC transport system permease protein